MTDHAHELRRHADKVGRPSGDVPAVMHAAAAHIEDLERRLREAEGHVHARIDEAVEAEREACAKVCESEGVTYDECMAGQMFAREIRALNKTGKDHES